MRVVYLLGNTGTHKSTYANVFAKQHGGIILDDDELYYSLNRKSWDGYYDEKIGRTIVRMIDEAIRSLWLEEYEGTVIITSLVYPLEQFVTTTKASNIRPTLIVTGNGDKTLAMENRKNTNRGKSSDEWIDVYNKNFDKIKQYSDAQILKAMFVHHASSVDILVLEHSENIEASKKLVETFAEELHD
jgi:hypothetical protein